MLGRGLGLLNFGFQGFAETQKAHRPDIGSTPSPNEQPEDLGLGFRA